MPTKELLFGKESREKIKDGIDILAEAVKATLGPKGQVVIIEQSHGAPQTTKDGVTVARAVELKDHFERMGADLVKEVAKKTNDIAGDGTTTATVLAQAIYAGGHKLIAAGANPVSVKSGIDAATKEVVLVLAASAVPVDSQEKLEQVAGISANDAALGKVIAGIMTEVGSDGLITLEESPSFGIETEVTKGMKIENGFVSPYMVTDPEAMKAEIQDCPVLVTDRTLTMGAELIPFLDKMAKSGKKNLLLVCENIDGEALAIAVFNKQRGAFNLTAVRCPGIGDHRKREVMRDICAVTGASFVSDEMGIKLQDADPAKTLGLARQVVVTQTDTVIIDGRGKQDDIDTRIGGIKTEIEKTKSDYDLEKLKQRLACLTGAVGVIKIGGKNEVAIKEEKQRVEDAVNAARAAREEGIVVGGGVALVRAANAVPFEKDGSDYAAGFQTLLNAVLEPLRAIAENAGKSGEVVLDKVRASEGNDGYNAATDTYEDLMLAGVIDPLKVTRTALENAASIAGLLLTTKAVIVNAEEKK